MKTSNILALRAVTAASIVALGSGTAWAQDAAPVIVLPDAPAAASVPAAPPSAPTTPTIVLPEPMAQAAPAAEPAPAAATVAPARESARPARAGTAKPAPRPTRAEAPADAAPVAEAPMAPEPMLADTAPIAAAPAPLAEPVARPVAEAPDTGDSTGLLAGLAGVVGLGGLALILLRRRRRDPEVEYTEVLPVDTPPAAAPVTPSYAFYDAPVSTTRPAVAAASAPFAAGPVPVGEEREELLNAMVAAAPDADNPFTSRKARRRRARLILQARELQQGTSAAPFDWRTYSPSRTDVDHTEARSPVTA